MKGDINISGLISGIIIGDVMFSIPGIFGIISIHDTMVLLVWLPVVMIVFALTIAMYDHYIGRFDKYKEKKEKRIENGRK